MVKTVFVFGCSGSGKTTAAHCIEMLARDNGQKWSTTRFNDYKIMYEWFKDDFEHRQFDLADYGGFDVLVPEIYDKAIEELTRKIWEHKPSEPELIIIDFARWDYSSSLELLGKDLLQHAYFLFLNADLKTCVQRVQQRVRNPLTIDDHFVPESVFECFRQRGEDYIASTVSLLNTKYEISEQKIRIIDNNTACSLQSFYGKLKDFVDYIKSQHTAVKNAELSILTNELAFK